MWTVVYEDIAHVNFSVVLVHSGWSGQIRDLSNLTVTSCLFATQTGRISLPIYILKCVIPTKDVPFGVSAISDYV